MIQLAKRQAWNYLFEKERLLARLVRALNNQN